MGKLKAISCEYCGTEWIFNAQPAGTNTGWEGFLMKNMYTHWYLCEKRTPAERREWATKTIKRLHRKPNDHTTLKFNFNHPGMINPDEPVAGLA